MGQDEIIRCLEKHSNNPISRKQIADELGDDVIKISHTIKKMLINESVKCIELDRFQSAKKLGLKRFVNARKFWESLNNL